MTSLGFIAAPPPPKILGPPLDTKVPGPPLIYLVGPLAISDPQGFPQVLQTWGASSKFDGGGLKSKHGGGGHGGSLKCCQKIPVKEFN